MREIQMRRVRDGKLVGIVTRANLLHALASVIAEAKPGLTSDAAIPVWAAVRPPGSARQRLADLVRRHQQPLAMHGAGRDLLLTDI